MSRRKAAHPRQARTGADLSGAVTGRTNIEDFKDFLWQDLQGKHYLDNELYSGLTAFNPTKNPHVRGGDIRFPAETTKDQLWEWYQTGMRHQRTREAARQTREEARRIFGEELWNDEGPFERDHEGRIVPMSRDTDDWSMEQWIDEHLSTSAQYARREGVDVFDPIHPIPDPPRTDTRAPREVMIQPAL